MKKEILVLGFTLALTANILFAMNFNITLRPEETKPAENPQVPATEVPRRESINILDVIFPTLPGTNGESTDATKAPEAAVPPAATEVPQPTQAPAATEAPMPTQAPVATEPPKETDKTYTTAELNDLDNDWITYGPGTATNGDPAPYAPDAQKLYGKYGAHFIEDAEDVIYLTFDCGYEYYLDGKPITGLILDTLKEKNVKAMFFISQSYVEKNPEMVQRILDEGHVLANHSSSHKTLPGMSIADMEAQILDLHKLVKDRYGYTMKFFRPPEGAFSLRSLAVTQNVGYETVHWSFGYADWNTENQPDPEEALKKILSCHHDGAIYLLHAVSATNAEILPQVIDGLQQLGYRLDVLR